MKKRYINLTLLVICFFIFGLESILLYKNELIQIDMYFYNKLIFTDSLTLFFKFITNLGSGLILITICIVVFLIFKNKKYNLFLLLNLILSFSLNYLFKIIFKRTRPIGINLIIEDGYSFPSGHTTVSTIFYGTIIYIIYKSNINKKIKILLITILSLLIILIGISRIYLGVHHSTDVIASYSLAIIYLLISIKIFKSRK